MEYMNNNEFEKNKEPKTPNEKSKHYTIKIIVALIVDIFLAYIAISLYEIYFVTGPISEAKPIIYFYPEQTTELNVKLGYPENLTCSYPKYENGWNIIANPDGSLIDINTGRSLYSLYWEGNAKQKISMDEGFVIKGEDTISFLEEKLAILGLNEIEAEEFIVYWLPKLQNNKYNYIKFATISWSSYDINSMEKSINYLNKARSVNGKSAYDYLYVYYYLYKAKNEFNDSYKSDYIYQAQKYAPKIKDYIFRLYRDDYTVVD